MTGLERAVRLCESAGFSREEQYGREDNEIVFTSGEGGNGTDCVPAPVAGAVSDRIRADVFRAMQQADELQAALTPEEYVSLMREIAEEATRRAEAALDGR